MPFDLQGARSAGIQDKDIVDLLSEVQKDFNVRAAYQDNVPLEDIVAEINRGRPERRTPLELEPTPQPVKPKSLAPSTPGVQQTPSVEPIAPLSRTRQSEPQERPSMLPTEGSGTPIPIGFQQSVEQQVPAHTMPEVERPQKSAYKVEIPKQITGAPAKVTHDPYARAEQIMELPKADRGREIEKLPPDVREETAGVLSRMESADPISRGVGQAVRGVASAVDLVERPRDWKEMQAAKPKGFSYMEKEGKVIRVPSYDVGAISKEGWKEVDQLSGFKERLKQGEALAKRLGIDNVGWDKEKDDIALDPNNEKDLDKIIELQDYAKNFGNQAIKNVWTYLREKNLQDEIEEYGKTGTAQNLFKTAEVLDPTDIAAYRIEQSAKQLKDSDPITYRAWKEGRLGVVADKLVAQAMLTGDEDKIQMAMDAADEVEKATAKNSVDERGLKKLYADTVRMLGPMAESMVKGAIPVVGKAWVTSDWAQQGAGDLYKQLRDAGVDHETASTIAPAAGLLYAQVENAQIAGLGDFFKGKGSDAVKRSMVKKIAKAVADRVSGAAQESLEESVQEIVIGGAREIAKEVSGVDKADISGVMKDAGDAFVQSLGPMLLTAGVGGAVSGARELSRGRATQPEQATQQPTAEQVTPQTPETALGVGQQPVGPEAAPQPVQQPVVDETDIETAALLDQGVEDDTQDITGIPSEVEIGQELEQAEPIQEAGREEVSAGGDVQGDEEVKPFAEKRWEFTVGGRKANRNDLDIIADRIRTKNPDMTPEQIKNTAYEAGRNIVTGVESVPHFNSWIKSVTSNEPYNDTKVNFFHLHGDEMAVGFAWTDDSGNQKSIVAKPDINFFGAFNDTEGVGHDFTDDLNTKFQRDSRVLFDATEKYISTIPPELKPQAVNLAIKQWKEYANNLEIVIPTTGKTVPLGISVGLGQDNDSAENALNTGKDTVGRNSIYVDNDTQKAYNISNVKGNDYLDQYIDAGLTSQKMEAERAKRDKSEVQGEVDAAGTGIEDVTTGLTGEVEGELEKASETDGKEITDESQVQGQSLSVVQTGAGGKVGTAVEAGSATEVTGGTETAGDTGLEKGAVSDQSDLQGEGVQPQPSAEGGIQGVEAEAGAGVQPAPEAAGKQAQATETPDVRQGGEPNLFRPDRLTGELKRLVEPIQNDKKEYSRQRRLAVKTMKSAAKQEGLPSENIASKIDVVSPNTPEQLFAVAYAKSRGFDPIILDIQDPTYRFFDGVSIAGTKGIAITNDTSRPFLTTTIHEITHKLEGTKEYNKLYEALAGAEGIFQEYWEKQYDPSGKLKKATIDRIMEFDEGKKKALGEAVYKRSIMRELAPEFMEQMAHDRTFWRKLYEKSPELVQKIIDIFESIIESIRGSDFGSIEEIRAGKKRRLDITMYVNDIEAAKNLAVEVMSKAKTKETEGTTSEVQPKAEAKTTEAQQKQEPVSEEVGEREAGVSEGKTVEQGSNEEFLDIDAGRDDDIPFARKFSEEMNDLFAGTEFEEKSKDEQARAMQKRELELRQAERKGGTADLFGLPMFRNKEIAGTEQQELQFARKFSDYTEQLSEIAKKYDSYNEFASDNKPVEIGSDSAYWHGSPSGDLRGTKYGLHFGTYKAAQEALHAHIGFPVDGEWDGTREYAKTKLRGKNSIKKEFEYGVSGFNVDAPDNDFYLSDIPKEKWPKYSFGEPIDPTVKPVIFPLEISGEMTNTPRTPLSDSKANSQMKAMMTRGTARRGYFYTNEAEDRGSVSAVVPNGDSVDILPTEEMLKNAWRDKGKKDKTNYGTPVSGWEGVQQELQFARRQEDYIEDNMRNAPPTWDLDKYETMWGEGEISSEEYLAQYNDYLSKLDKWAEKQPLPAVFKTRSGVEVVTPNIPDGFISTRFYQREGDSFYTPVSHEGFKTKTQAIRSNIENDYDIGEDIRFARRSASAKESGVYDAEQKSEVNPDQKNLVAIHNLSSYNIKFVSRLGGIPVPSIAITRTGVPFDGFGEVSLIGDKDLIDPKYVSVFDADVYSPRAPEIRYRPNKKLRTEILNDMYRVKWEKIKESGYGRLQEYIEHDKKKRAIESIDDKSSTGLRLLFLEENNVDVEVVKEKKRPFYSEGLYGQKPFMDYVESRDHSQIDSDIRSNNKELISVIKKSINIWATQMDAREGIRETILENFTDGEEVFFGTTRRAIDEYFDMQREPETINKNKTIDNIDSAVKKTGIQKFKKWAKDKFEEIWPEENAYIERGRTKAPVNLENFVDIMTRRGIKSQEKTIFHDLGMARSAGARKFKDVEQLRKNASRIITREQMKIEKKKQDEKWGELWAGAKPYYENSSTFGALDDLSRSIADYYKGRKGVSGMQSALSKNGYKGVPEYVAEEAIEFADYLRNMPTEYFEAKLQVGVPLSEFKGAVIPSDTDNETRDILTGSGLPIVEYDRNKNGDRAEKVKSFGEEADILFARRQEYDLPKTIEVDGKKLPTENSEGRAIADTEEKIRNFWKWFGDSKVVDGDGRPLVVYHGTPSGGFTDFDIGKLGTTTKAKSAQKGIFFAKSPYSATSYQMFDIRDHIPKNYLRDGFLGGKTIVDTAPQKYKDIYNKYDEIQSKVISDIKGEANKVVVKPEGKLLSIDRDKLIAFVNKYDPIHSSGINKLKTLPKIISSDEYLDDFFRDRVNIPMLGSLTDKYKKYSNEIITQQLNRELLQSFDKAPSIYKTFLDIKNPHIVDFYGNSPSNKKGYKVSSTIDKAIDQGNDGVIIKNIVDGGPKTDHYIVFSPNQIKSATGNLGTFSAEDADIRFARQAEQERTTKGQIEHVNNVRAPYDLLTGQYKVDQYNRELKSAQRRFAKYKNIAALDARTQATLGVDAFGQMVPMVERALAEKADLRADMLAIKDTMLTEMRKLIRNYARKANYKGGVTADMMDRLQTPSVMRKVIQNIDRWVERDSSKNLRNRIISMLKNYKKRLKNWDSGKTKSPIPEKNRRALNEYIDNILNDDGIIGRRKRMDIADIVYRETELSKPKAERSRNVKPLDDNERTYLAIYNKLNTVAENGSDEVLSDEEKDFLALAVQPTIWEMDSGQLNTLLGEIQHIYKDPEGRTRIKKEREREARIYEGKVNRIVEQIKASTSEKKLVGSEKAQIERAIETTRKERKGKSFSERLRDIGSAAKWEYIRPELIAEFFTDKYQMLGQTAGHVSRYIFKPMLDANVKKLKGLEEHKKKILEATKDIDKTLVDKPAFRVSYVEEYDEDGNPKGRNNMLLTLNEAMFIYANSKNEGNRRHILGNGFDAVSIAEVVKALPLQAKEAVDNIIDYYDNDIYKKMNEAYKATIGVDMGKEQNYFPIMNLDRSNQENQVLIDLMQRHSATLPSIEKGMTIQRVKSAIPYRKLDFFGTVFNHMQAVEHYIAFQKPVNQVRKIMTNKAVRSAMETKSEGAYKAMDSWFRDVAAGRILDVPTSFIDKYADFVRKNFGVFALGLNPRVMAKQAASLMIGSAFTNPGNVMRNALVGAKERVSTVPGQDTQMTKFVHSKSEAMRNRAKTMERDIEELRKDKEQMKFFGVGAKMEQLRDISMAGIQYFDKMTTVVLWKSKYDELISKGKSEREAVRTADALIRRTQPEGAVLNLPKGFRKKGLVAAFTMFTNQINQHLNMLYMMERGIKSKDVSTEKKVEVATKTFFAMLASSSIIFFINNALKKQAFGDEPEELAKEFVMGAGPGSLPFANVLIGRTLDILANESRKRTGRKPKYLWDFSMSPSVIAPLEASYKAVEEGVGAVSAFSIGDKSVATKRTIKALERGAEAGSAFTGLPASQLIRTAKGAGNVSEYGWKALFYPESRLKDYSLKAAMAERAAKKSLNPEDIAWLGKFSEGLLGGEMETFVNYAVAHTGKPREDIIKSVTKAVEEYKFKEEPIREKLQKLEDDYGADEIDEEEYKKRKNRLTTQLKRYKAVLK